MMKTTPYYIYVTALLLFVSSKLCAQSAYLVEVDEYVPAPGQFVNTMPLYEEGDDARLMADKCTAALVGNSDGMITLGAYGGYITFHFDHPVVNVKGKNDFMIKGNAIDGSSEPGIVMVSVDENRNGKPDDKWYELSGSADVDSIGKVKYGYSLTYHHAPMGDIPWEDSDGNNGFVSRNPFHAQEYFPLWIEDDLTFTGTLLPQNAHDLSGNGTYWVMDSFRYGYVDNMPNTNRDGCSFNIDWAVDGNRHPVELAEVDFIRVYNAMNQYVGWLGETSTEFCGAEDLHPNEPSVIKLIEEGETATEYYNINGVLLHHPVHGIIIEKTPDGKKRKILNPIK